MMLVDGGTRRITPLFINIIGCTERERELGPGILTPCSASLDNIGLKSRRRRYPGSAMHATGLLRFAFLINLACLIRLSRKTNGRSHNRNRERRADEFLSPGLQGLRSSCGLDVLRTCQKHQDFTSLLSRAALEIELLDSDVGTRITRASTLNFISIIPPTSTISTTDPIWTNLPICYCMRFSKIKLARAQGAVL